MANTTIISRTGFRIFIRQFWLYIWAVQWWKPIKRHQVRWNWKFSKFCISGSRQGQTLKVDFDLPWSTLGPLGVSKQVKCEKNQLDEREANSLLKVHARSSGLEQVFKLQIRIAAKVSRLHLWNLVCLCRISRATFQPWTPKKS